MDADRTPSVAQTPERPLPRTIYVKVSTELLAELGRWSEPVRVMAEQQHDDTYELIFRREET